jgi:predicted NAD/FAD-dependent oxidoreductase
VLKQVVHHSRGIGGRAASESREDRLQDVGIARSAVQFRSAFFDLADDHVNAII